MSLVIVDRYTVTNPEERLDHIAEKLYGSEGDGAVDRLLDANPGLADTVRVSDGYVPFGTVLDIPERLELEPVLIVRPWL